jgi:choline dehydrogenase-like flavoprotein
MHRSGVDHGMIALVRGRLFATAGPSDSVADAAGRVLGMPGLHVVYSSVQQRSCQVNCALTIYALAFRCPDPIVRHFAHDAKRAPLATELFHVI